MLLVPVGAVGLGRARVVRHALLVVLVPEPAWGVSTNVASKQRRVDVPVGQETPLGHEPWGGLESHELSQHDSERSCHLRQSAEARGVGRGTDHSFFLHLPGLLFSEHSLPPSFHE